MGKRHSRPGAGPHRENHPWPVALLPAVATLFADDRLTEARTSMETPPQADRCRISQCERRMAAFETVSKTVLNRVVASGDSVVASSACVSSKRWYLNLEKGAKMSDSDPRPQISLRLQQQRPPSQAPGSAAGRRSTPRPTPMNSARSTVTINNEYHPRASSSPLAEKPRSTYGGEQRKQNHSE